MCRIAVILTCHNRKSQTMASLSALFDCENPFAFNIDTYIVDDGSSDGTAELVLKAFPSVKIIQGDGNLFWAGGMRLAWKTAIETKIRYDFFLLLNDDTRLFTDAFINLFNDLKYIGTNKTILVGNTIDPDTKELTYGGRRLLKENNPKDVKIIPNNATPQICDLGNGNIMLVGIEVVENIGILSQMYTHGIADFDYILRARADGILTYITSKCLGECVNDHGNTWLSSEAGLRKRIQYLYSVKGLSYNEYMCYIKSHFPKYIIQAKIKLWLKTLFPFLWDKFKR